MRILVCVKRVPAPGAKIKVSGDGQSVDAAHLGFTTSPHEECGVEEAVQIAGRTGGEVTVLTVGPDEAEEQLRYAASVGADKAVLVPTDGSAIDPQRTAAIITEAVQEIEVADGTFDLIIFGNESADSGGFQVGIRVANTLGRPMVNAIKQIEVEDDAIVARREIDAGLEEYRLPRPAIVGVKEGINLPRYPTMKGRLASKKVEVDRAELDAEAGGQSLVALKEPAETVSETVILGDSEDAAPVIVDLLEELGVLS